MKSMEYIAHSIADHVPTKIPGRKLLTRASTAVVIDKRPALNEPSVLLIRRAARKGDPWSGHMAFPGGKLSALDLNILYAATREMNEETGIDPHRDIAPLGRLSDVLTRSHSSFSPMVITPHVFRLRREPKWRLNHEVDEVVWVPLSFLADQGQRKRMTWRFAFKTWRMPCYEYQDNRIWGLTLLTLDELLFCLDGRTTYRQRRIRTLLDML